MTQNSLFVNQMNQNNLFQSIYHDRWKIMTWVWSRGEHIVFWWPNTNTNIIQFPKNDRIQIRISFGFPKMTKYKYEYNSVSQKMTEYEYYSVSQKWPNMNTNIIRFPKNDRIRIRILFGLPKMTEYEYEYFSATQKWLIANTNIILLPNNDRKQISFGLP